MYVTLSFTVYTNFYSNHTIKELRKFHFVNQSNIIVNWTRCAQKTTFLIERGLRMISDCFDYVWDLELRQLYLPNDWCN